MSQWTDESRQQVIDQYTAGNPTPENTLDLIEQIAEEHEKTVNGVRMILSKASVYVSKTANATSATSDSGDKPKRKTKQESLDELSAILTKHGVEADVTIIDKLTGKAADYFTASITHIIEN